MNILRRTAQLVLEVNKIQAEAAVRLYGRLHIYKLVYSACGLPDEVAARLEAKIINAMFSGIEEQHELACQWLRGESDLADFVDRYTDWLREHLDRCSAIAVEELCQAA